MAKVKRIHKDLSLTAAQAPYFRIFVANWNTDDEGQPLKPTVEILYEEEYSASAQYTAGIMFSLWFKSRSWAFAFGADWAIKLVENINPMIAQGIVPVEDEEGGQPNG